MARIRVSISAAIMLLSGCDTVYPPQFVNAYGIPIVVTLTYSDGQSTVTTWPACREFFVGKADAQVENVTFEGDGKVLREFSSVEIDRMLERENGERGFFAWVVAPDVLKPINDRNQVPCAQP